MCSSTRSIARENQCHGTWFITQCGMGVHIRCISISKPQTSKLLNEYHAMTSPVTRAVVV